MRGALEAKAEALGKSELVAEAAERSARSHAQRAKALEAEKREMAAALQEARDEKENFKGEVSAQNSEALKKIEDTWKRKLAAKQAEVDAGLEEVRGLTEKAKSQGGPRSPPAAPMKPAPSRPRPRLRPRPRPCGLARCGRSPRRSLPSELS